MTLGNLISKFYHQRHISKIFHTLPFCLQEELKDCQSVLDIGCGPLSPLQYCRNVKKSVGVEPYTPYFLQACKNKIHNKYLKREIRGLTYPVNSFDAVIMIEVIEHLPKKVGKEILLKAEKWARKKIIVTTPNGFFSMGEVDKNPWQTHKSGWIMADFTKLSFVCHGLAGAKFFYHSRNQVSEMVDKDAGNIFTNIRFSPKALFYLLNSFIQIITYFLPEVAFELLAVKKINENKQIS